MFFILAYGSGRFVDDYRPKVTEHQLDNGMRFLILEDKSAPVAVFHVQVRAGSVYEQPGETGMNHLIEHLAFAGTKKIGTTNWQEEKKLLEKLDKIHFKIVQAREEGRAEEDLKLLKDRFEKVRLKASGLAEANHFAAILDREGAVGPNAFVSHDFTVYWVELPSHKLELWACLESERLFNSVFRLFYEEIEIVKEERRTVVENSPTGRLQEEFRAAAYQVHPYRHPVIGYMEDIEIMNRARVKDLYSKYYVPSNILVSIVGDVCPKKTVPILEKYFGSVPAQEAPVFDLPQEPERKAERRTYIQMGAQPILLVGFNTPCVNHPDIAALRVLAQIFGQGRTSRLYQRLVKKEKVAVTVSSWLRASRYPGLFQILAMTADGYSNEDIEPLIYDEIKKLLKSPPTQKEIEAAQARLKIDFIQNLKARRSLASGLAWFQDVTGSWENFFKMEEAIAEVKLEDILDVVERYFRKDNRTVGSLKPRGQNK